MNIIKGSSVHFMFNAESKYKLQSHSTRPADLPLDVEVYSSFRVHTAPAQLDTKSLKQGGANMGFSFELSI